jgi:AcrR family transcriptional regulator
VTAHDVSGDLPRLTRKGQATRERIVAAAAQLMFERGVAGTNLEDVKARAGVSSSQLYHYFGDRRDLVSAVIAHQTDTVLAAQPPQLDSLEAFAAWRDHTVAAARALDCRGGCPIGSLAGQLAEGDPRARRELADGFDRWEAALRDGLRAMSERGELRPEADPDALALAMLASLQGGILLAQVRRDPRPIETALDASLDRLRSLAVAPG